MDQAIQDGVGDGGIGEADVPFRHGHLGSHQRRGSAVPVIQDFEQLLRLRTGEGITEPVVLMCQIGWPVMPFVLAENIAIVKKFFAITSAVGAP